eukprot:15545156-Heterocapsa_arctica.AAC.1
MFLIIFFARAKVLVQDLSSCLQHDVVVLKPFSSAQVGIANKVSTWPCSFWRASLHTERLKLVGGRLLPILEVSYSSSTSAPLPQVSSEAAVVQEEGRTSVALRKGAQHLVRAHAS